jgi:hypothetical protein
MKRVKTLGIAILAIGLTFGALQRKSAASTHCRSIDGHLTVSQYTVGCTSPVGWCTSGSVYGGLLGGSADFILSDSLPGVTTGSLSYDGTRSFTTSTGVLQIHESGLVNIGARRFAAYGLVSGGTGSFAGATGTVFLYGYSNEAGDVYNGSLDGRVCGAGIVGND